MSGLDFFARQRLARSQSRRLLWLFVLAVLTLVMSLDLALALLLGMLDSEHARGFWPLLRDNADALLALGASVVLVVFLAMLYRMAQLRQGGAVVARELGGEQVGPDTGDPALRRLRNVVEEIAIASALPVPAVFVLEQESGINAFAAGWGPSDAAIAVTRGALDRLNRDELQGVIAHEFSHILNGDMRLNLRLVGVLFGIMVIGLLGRQLLRAGRGRGRGAAQVALVGLAMYAFGGVGLFFGRLIQAGISRQREYLADASAVQFTRQNAGLAGALKKIAGVSGGSLLRAGDGRQVSHMLFGDGVGFSDWWSTHPPLLARIKAIDPTFVAAEIKQLRQRYAQSPPDGLAEDMALGLVGANPALPAVRGRMPIDPAHLAQRIGAPVQMDFAAAAAVLASMPDALASAARDPQRVIALVLGLLEADDPAIASVQSERIGAHMGAATAQAVGALALARHGLHPMLRLPLVELAAPALRRRPRAELQTMLECVDAMARADGEVDLFEYCLAAVLRAQVLHGLDPVRHWQPARYKLKDVAEPAAHVLALLAWHGHAEPTAARQAFAAAMHRLLPDAPLRLSDTPLAPSVLDTAIPELMQLQPAGKEMLIEAMSVAAAHDGQIAVAEAELLRTLCVLLHCPLPPLLHASVAQA